MKKTRSAQRSNVVPFPSQIMGPEIARPNPIKESSLMEFLLFGLAEPIIGRLGDGFAVGDGYDHPEPVWIITKAGGVE